MSNHAELTEEALHNAAIQSLELNIVHNLGLMPFKDGNQFCFLYGENLQTGIAGFGDTVYLAMLDFNHKFVAEKA